MSAGKAMFFAGAAKSNTITSKDTPYNGVGTCTGYVYERDGKSIESDVCVRTTADGDSWGVTSTMLNPETKRGIWTATFGTGKFAKNMGSTGWYEVVTEDDKTSSGKWGGNCVGVK
jgi:predicted ThiF/HesA family dinucleotide-utilizing enzyme